MFSSKKTSLLTFRQMRRQEFWHHTQRRNTACAQFCSQQIRLGVNMWLLAAHFGASSQTRASTQKSVAGRSCASLSISRSVFSFARIMHGHLLAGADQIRPRQKTEPSRWARTVVTDEKMFRFSENGLSAQNCRPRTPRKKEGTVSGRLGKPRSTKCSKSTRMKWK